MNVVILSSMSLFTTSCKNSPGLFVCLTMVDVPGRDGVADEPGEEMMGEPDEDGVGEVIGVVSGDGVQQPSGMKENRVSSINKILFVTCHRIHLY